jgi:hypothetical protein
MQLTQNKRQQPFLIAVFCHFFENSAIRLPQASTALACELAKVGLWDMLLRYRSQFSFSEV